METLEVHTLICKRDVQWWIDTIKLFKHHSKLNFITVVHDDGSFDDNDCDVLKNAIIPIKIWRRKDADAEVSKYLINHPNCFHFRYAEHHTIFRIKLFDNNPFETLKLHLSPMDKQEVETYRFKVPADTNSWVWNNLRTKHGSFYDPSKRKILLILSTFNIDWKKYDSLLERSVSKFENEYCLTSTRPLDDFVNL